MEFKIATADDVPAISKMAVQFRNMLNKEKPTDSEFENAIVRLMNGNDAEFVIAVDEKSLISGYILIRYYFSMWIPGYEARIEDLFVDPNARKNGIGKKLTTFAVERAKEKNCRSVYLDTNENNEASNKIYNTLGFISTSKAWNGGKQIFYRLSLA